MQRIVLRIAGNANTKQRQRFDPRSKRAYTPKANIISENDVRAIWREAGEPRIEGKPAIRMLVVITVPRPSSHFNSKGELNKKGLEMPRPSNKKPDTDNAIKTIMDALNSRAYHDDVQVVEHAVVRDWGEWPATLVVIEEVPA